MAATLRHPLPQTGEGPATCPAAQGGSRGEEQASAPLKEGTPLSHKTALGRKQQPLQNSELKITRPTRPWPCKLARQHLKSQERPAQHGAPGDQGPRPHGRTALAELSSSERLYSNLSPRTRVCGASGSLSSKPRERHRIGVFPPAPTQVDHPTRGQGQPHYRGRN